ncbi:histidine kinase, partial [Streptomyces sp. NPDC007856]
PDIPALPRRARPPEPSADGAGAAADVPALSRRTRSSEPAVADGTGATGRAGAGPGERGGEESRPSGRTPGHAAEASGDEPATGPLPRRVRQASLAPQLKQNTARRAERAAQPADRDAEEVRSRMASLQRGWRRGREENAGGDGDQTGTAQGTTKGDGR